MIGPKLYRHAWKQRLKSRYRAIGAFLVAMIVVASVVPTGISTNEHVIVTGHSTFFDGVAHDPCLAAIVGIMRMQVLWFNDQILVERYSGDGSYLYVTEKGAPDPRDQPLVNSGVYYAFEDPNGAEWYVREAFYDPEHAVNVDHEGANNAMGAVRAASEAEGGTVRYYTWIVQIGEARHDPYIPEDGHSKYNFVTLVNTCKFQPRNYENAFAGVDEHEQQNNTAETGHEEGFKTHEHETWHVDLYVGEPPDLLPVGAEPPNWVSGSFAGEGEGENRPPAGRNPHPDP